MNTGKYLQEKQPYLAKSFLHAFQGGKSSHAYLIVGEPGTPLKDTALLLAKTFLCDHPNPFADETCNTCTRIANGEYPDFVFLNGESESIKKDTIKETINLFHMTPLERKGTMVYIIHLVENMVPAAESTLLKFLEEPTTNTYAILTTQNEEKVLPTVISRCEKLRLLPTPREEVFQEAVALGANPTDARILSRFHNYGESIHDLLTKDEMQKERAEYLAIKEAAVNLVSAASYSPHLARFTAEKDIAPLLTTKPKSRLFFDILSALLEEIVAIKSGREPTLSDYATITEEAANKLPHVENSLLSAMTLRGEVEMNIKIVLLLNHLVNILVTE